MDIKVYSKIIDVEEAMQELKVQLKGEIESGYDAEDAEELFNEVEYFLGNLEVYKRL